MPLYTANFTQGVWPGDQATVLTTADTLSAGSKSQAIALGTTGSARPATLRFQYDATTSMGTFEWDLQESNSDIDADYQTTLTQATAVNNSCFIVLVNPAARFYRALLKTLTGTIVGVGTFSC